MKHLVLYHANCMDGTAAAAAHQMGVDYKDGDLNYQYVPINYDVKTPELLDEHLAKSELTLAQFDVVWMLDFCLLNPILDKLTQANKIVIIIDHHKTAIDQLAEFKHPRLFYILSADNQLSGAGLSYLFRHSYTQLFHFLTEVSPKTFKSPKGYEIISNIPTIESFMSNYHSILFEWIRIRDVWDESDPTAKHNADMFFYAITNRGCFELPKFKKFLVEYNEHETASSRDMSRYLFDLMNEGKLVYSVHRNSCETAIKGGYKVVVDGTHIKNIQVLITASPVKQDSLLGDMWRELHPDQPTLMVGLSYMHKECKVVAGLRSNHLIDCLTLAKQLGGGGHLRAAGCDLSPFLGAHGGIEYINEFITDLIKEIY